MNKALFKHIRLNNIFSSSKALARYKTHPTTYPSQSPKPMNPWDNIDPGRRDNSLLDEYDQLRKI